MVNQDEAAPTEAAGEGGDMDFSDIKKKKKKKELPMDLVNRCFHIRYAYLLTQVFSPSVYTRIMFNQNRVRVKRPRTARMSSPI